MGDLVPYTGSTVIRDAEVKKMRSFTQKVAKNKARALSQQLLGILSFIIAYIISIIVFVNFGSTAEYYFILLICVSIMSGISIFFLNTINSQKRNEVTGYECNSCTTPLNLADQWTCGSCGYNNNVGYIKYLSKFSTPFTKCSNPDCNHSTPTAMHCPNCNKHLVLNQDEYARFSSSERPFEGVAQVQIDHEEIRIRRATELAQESSNSEFEKLKYDILQKSIDEKKISSHQPFDDI